MRVDGAVDVHDRDGGDERRSELPGLDAADVTVSNTDNDVAGVTVTPTSGLTTTEARRDGDVHGGAQHQPTADVTIALSSSDTTEGTVSPASLTFTTGTGTWRRR
jgi:hypothetical protein